MSTPPGPQDPNGAEPPSYGSVPPAPQAPGSQPPGYGAQPPSYGSVPPAPPAYGGGGGGGYGGGFPGGGTEKNSLGVWALVLGILSIVCCGFFTGIPAVILGNKSKAAAAQGQANNGNLGNIGMILGWVGIALSILGIILSASGVIDYSTYYNVG